MSLAFLVSCSDEVGAYNGYFSLFGQQPWAPVTVVMNVVVVLVAQGGEPVATMSGSLRRSHDGHPLNGYMAKPARMRPLASIGKKAG